MPETMPMAALVRAAVLGLPASVADIGPATRAAAARAARANLRVMIVSVGLPAVRSADVMTLDPPAPDRSSRGNREQIVSLPCVRCRSLARDADHAEALEIQSEHPLDKRCGAGFSCHRQVGLGGRRRPDWPPRLGPTAIVRSSILQPESELGSTRAKASRAALICPSVMTIGGEKPIASRPFGVVEMPLRKAASTTCRATAPCPSP